MGEYSVTHDDERRTPAATARLSIAGPLWAVGLVAAGLTLLVALAPLRFAYRSEPTHVAIETAALLIGSLAAVLLGGRAIREGRRSDLMAAAGLATLALTNLLFGLLPDVFGSDADSTAWAALAGRLAGAAVFAAAAILTDRRLADPRRAARHAAAAVVVLAGVLAVAAVTIDDRLPVLLDPDLSPEDASRPLVTGHPVLIAVQAVLIVVFAGATAGYAARARKTGDRFVRGLAIASLISAFARLNYFMFPSVVSEWVYTGDILRLAFYLTILGALSMELLDYQRRAAVVAVLDERRRVARELHDGLAQELAFIRSEARRMTGDGPHVLVSAADRAIDESRTAIATLSRPSDEPLLDALRHAAQSVAVRGGAQVTVAGNGDPAVGSDLRHALVRIVREATTNAIRHGRAREVRLELDCSEGLRIVISDDGQGFDTTAPLRPDAYGLVGMRERVEALRGTLSVRSTPGEGTAVEVLVP